MVEEPLCGDFKGRLWAHTTNSGTVNAFLGFLFLFFLHLEYAHPLLGYGVCPMRKYHLYLMYCDTLKCLASLGSLQRRKFLFFLELLFFIILVFS